jgi:hypothetical protein
VVSKKSALLRGGGGGDGNGNGIGKQRASFPLLIFEQVFARCFLLSPFPGNPPFPSLPLPSSRFRCRATPKNTSAAAAVDPASEVAAAEDEEGGKL